MEKEKFINEVLENLVAEFSCKDLETIKKTLVMVSSKYKVEKQCTDVVLYKKGVPDCCKTYLAIRIVEGLSKNSIELYNLRLTQFFNTVNKDINDITANDVRLYLYMYQEQKKCNNTTLSNIQTIIKTFFGWANAEGYISKNPCLNLKPIKCEKRLRGHLSEDEVERIREVCDTSQKKALFEILYSTGCRVSEIVGMNISDINFETKEVKVIGKGNKERIVYLNTKSILALKKYIENKKGDDPALFTKTRYPYDRIKKNGIESIIKKLGESANLERQLFPHLIRHTTATIGVNRGMEMAEVQKMLGHKDISTTLIYAEVCDTDVKSKHKKAIV